MATISTNEYLLNEMKSMNSDLEGISFNPSTNIMTFNGHSIDLSNFSLAEIYSEYSQLKADVAVMKPEDLFNAISINVAVQEKQNKKNVNNEESIDQIKEISPTIQNISLIKKEDELGQEKNYVYIVTSDGASHILYDKEPKDVLIAFKNLTEKNGNNPKAITENDLYDELKRSMQDISLVDSRDAQSRSDLSDDFKNKLSTMESYANRYGNNDGTRVQGNAEHDIYIQNSQVVTYNTDTKGNIVRQDHNGGSLSDNETQNDLTNSETQGSNEMKDEIIEVDVSRLIDVKEYTTILESANELSTEEQDKISFFEGFMADLYAYKDYLGTDALAMWNEYEHYIIVISSLGEYNNKQQDAIDNYTNMQENTKKVELKNAKNKALILEYQAEIARKQAQQQSIAGTVNAIFVVEITTFLSIALASLIYFVLK